MVELTIQLPDGVAESFGRDSGSAARQLLESAAAEAFRSGKISRHQVRQMLNLSWHQTEEFLRRCDPESGYTVAALNEDHAALSKLFSSEFTRGNVQK